MGKGNRNNQQRLDNQAVNAERSAQKEKAKVKKKRSDKAIAAACAVFALLIVAVLVLNVLTETGVFLRVETAVSQDSVEVDSAMMSFFYNDYLLNWYNNYYSYLGYFSVNLGYNLKTQTYGKGLETYFCGEYDGTWYDYFLDQVTDEVDMYVTYAVAAKKAGITLTEDDKKEINDTIKNLKESLKSTGASFADWYGRGVSESDVRRCYELIYLASNFSEKKQAELKEQLDKDDKPVYTYIEENKGDFYSAEVLSYKITLAEKNFKDQKTYDLAVKLAKDSAEKMASAKTPAEFVSFVKEYEATTEATTTTSTSMTTGTETGTTTETETLSPEEQLEKDIEGLKSTLNYETDDELGKWLFGYEGNESKSEASNPAAEEGDANVIEVTGTETVKETTGTGTGTTTEAETTKNEESTTAAKKTTKTYTVTAYYVVKASSLDKSLTKDMAYLIADNKAEVEKFIASFKASAGKDIDVFTDLASKQYDKLHEGHDHSDSSAKEPVFSYSSAEKATDKYFSADYQKLNEWLDTGKLEKNAISDIIEITIDKTTYYAVVYFQNYEEEAWYVGGYDGVLAEQFDDWYQAELAKKLIKHNDKALADLPTISLTTSAS